MSKSGLYCVGGSVLIYRCVSVLSVIDLILHHLLLFRKKKKQIFSYYLIRYCRRKKLRNPIEEGYDKG
jgi:hypothetical protein